MSATAMFTTTLDRDITSRQMCYLYSSLMKTDKTDKNRGLNNNGVNSGQ